MSFEEPDKDDDEEEDDAFDELFDELERIENFEDLVNQAPSRPPEPDQDEEPEEEPASSPAAPEPSPAGFATWYEEACQAVIAGKFEIRGELGRGGMGVVLDGFDLGLQRRVAIKRPFPGHDGYIARFKSEAMLIAQLKCEFIREVLEFGCDDHGYYLVMEFVDGWSLHEYVQDAGAFAHGDVLDLAVAMTTALKVAHAAGVIHRDVKPGNVLVDKKGRFKLADFGLARPAEGTGRTQTGPMGTRHYAAPEQWKNARDADERSDIYGMGVTIRFAFTGRKRPGSSDEQVMGSFASFVAHCTEGEPDDRYQSAAEALEALEALRSQLSGRSGGSTARRPLAGRPGVCPECRVVNPENHEYCTGCGAPLRGTCPICETEVLAADKYCGACRVNLCEWRELLTTLDRAFEHAVGERYERAEEEIERARQLGGDRPEFPRLEARVREDIESLTTERSAAEPLWEARRFEEAVPHLERILELAPGDEKTQERLEGVAERARERDLDSSSSDLDRAIEDRRIAEARRIVRRIGELGLPPDDSRVARAHQRYRALRSEMIRRARIDFVSALEAHDWPEVRRLLERLRHAGTGRVLLSELRRRAGVVRALSEDDLVTAREFLESLADDLDETAPPWLERLFAKLELAETVRIDEVYAQIEASENRTELRAARRVLIDLDQKLGPVRAEELNELKHEFRRRVRRRTWKRRRRVVGVGIGLIAGAMFAWVYQTNRIWGDIFATELLDEDRVPEPMDKWFREERVVLLEMKDARAALKRAGGLLTELSNEELETLYSSWWTAILPLRARDRIKEVYWIRESPVADLRIEEARYEGGTLTVDLEIDAEEKEAMLLRYRRAGGSERPGEIELGKGRHSIEPLEQGLKPFERVEFEWWLESHFGKVARGSEKRSVLRSEAEVVAEQLKERGDHQLLIEHLEKNKDAWQREAFKGYVAWTREGIADEKQIGFEVEVWRSASDKEPERILLEDGGLTERRLSVNGSGFELQPMIYGGLTNSVWYRWCPLSGPRRDRWSDQFKCASNSLLSLADLQIPEEDWGEGGSVRIELTARTKIHLEPGEWAPSRAGAWDPSIALVLRRDDTAPSLEELEARAVIKATVNDPKPEKACIPINLPEDPRHEVRNRSQMIRVRAKGEQKVVLRQSIGNEVEAEIEMIYRDYPSGDSSEGGSEKRWYEHIAKLREGANAFEIIINDRAWNEEVYSFVLDFGPTSAGDSATPSLDGPEDSR